MSLDRLKDALPAYAQDLSANLSTLMAEPTMSDPQKWGTFIACAYAVGVGRVIRELEDGCPLSAELANAAKGVAAMMAMNNVYYRAMHVITNREYTTQPVRLRMNAIARPGAPKMDFELWCLAVSAINGCSACMNSHEQVLRTHGVGAPVVQAALRIASVVYAVSRVIAAEEGARAD